MATRETVVWVCDLCGSTDLIDTHTVTVDGHAVQLEACDECWQRMMVSLAPMHKAGRTPVLTKVSARKNVVPFPGLAWKFTAHALKRMGERHINPVSAAAAADEPELTTPGNDGSGEVRVKGNVKVVVLPDRGLIITASKRDEAVDHVS